MSGARFALFQLLLLVVIAAFAVAQDTPKSQADPDATSQSSATTAPSDNRVIIKVGDKKVTEAEFESNIGEFEPKGDADKIKDRRRQGDDYASVVMLSQQAVADQLESSPDVRQQLEIARLQILSDAEFAKLLSQTKPSADEVNQYYSSHSSDFDEVKVRRLFIWKMGKDSKNTHGLSPEEAKARADAILKASTSGGDAMKLADAFKDSKEGLFDARPETFVRGQLPAKMDNVAFGMKVGTWAEADNTPDRVILLYLSARDREPLADVRETIEKMVQGEKMKVKLDEMKKKAGIWMDQQYFGSDSAVAKDPGEQRPASEPLKETRN